MKLMGVEIVIDDSMLDNKIKMVSTINEVVVDINTGQEVIDVEHRGQE